MSSRHDVDEATLRNWANLGYITSTRIKNQMFLDEEDFIAYLDAHKRAGVGEEYLAKMIEEKKMERDFIISQFDDTLYVLKMLKTSGSLFETVVYELSQFISPPEKRDIFYAISTGEPIERVARRHHVTYGHVLRIYESLLDVLKHKKEFLATYRKQALEARMERMSRRDAEIRAKFIVDIADTRSSIALKVLGIHTVGQLLDQVAVNLHGWKGLLGVRNMGVYSLVILLTRLKKAGVDDPNMLEVLAKYEDRVPVEKR